jgi:Uma2 family endonuclease
MQETGDPTTLAPEICVEVLSESNTAEEMEEKRAVYFDAGADEVWLVDLDGQVRFFGEAEMEESVLAPGMPKNF